MALSDFGITNDAVGAKFDIGTLKGQPVTKEQMLRRAIELRQSIVDQIAMRSGPKARSAGPVTGGQAALRSGVQRTAEAITGIPDLVATMSANVVAGSNYGIPGKLAQMFGVNVPKVGERIIPGIPSGQDVMAGVDMAGEAAAALKTGNFGQFSASPSESSRMRTESFAQEQPLASKVGATAADVASLLAMRNPVAGERAMAELGFKADKMVKASKEAAAMEALAANPAANLAKLGIEFAPDAKAAMDYAVRKSDGLQSALRQAGRAGEAGIESFALNALQGGDPVEGAAYTAGGQMVGGLFLGGLNKVFQGGMSQAGMNILVSSASIGALLLALKTATPGGNDFTLQSLESGFNKVVSGMAVGAIAGLSGAGRVTSKFPVTMLPKIADTITALPRAATISLLSDAMNDTRAERIIKQLAVDPEYFGPTAARRLSQAYRNPDISITGVIDDLMEQKQFRDKFQALEKAN